MTSKIPAVLSRTPRRAMQRDPAESQVCAWEPSDRYLETQFHPPSRQPSSRESHHARSCRRDSFRTLVRLGSVQVSIERARASAAIPAVSKRKVPLTSDAGVKPPSIISWRSRSSRPPSGPSAIETGATRSIAISFVSARPSRRILVPSGAAAIARDTGAEG
jgi:hypothetical protein